jgi:hypothetical protein
VSQELRAPDGNGGDLIEVEDLVAAQDDDRPGRGGRIAAVTAVVVAAGVVAGGVALGPANGNQPSPQGAGTSPGTGQGASAPDRGGSSAAVTARPPSSAPASPSASEPAGSTPGPAATPPTTTRPSPAGPTPAAAGRHVVAAGESLWTITAQALGDRATPAAIMDSWPAVYAANRSVIGADPDRLLPGQELVLPALP